MRCDHGYLHILRWDPSSVDDIWQWDPSSVGSGTEITGLENEIETEILLWNGGYLRWYLAMGSFFHQSFRPGQWYFTMGSFFEVRDALDLLIHVHSKTKIMRCDRRRYSGSWSFSFDFITREKGFVSMNSHGYRRCSWSFSFVFQTFWFNFITRESFLCIHRIPTWLFMNFYENKNCECDLPLLLLFLLLFFKGFVLISHTGKGFYVSIWIPTWLFSWTRSRFVLSFWLTGLVDVYWQWEPFFHWVEDELRNWSMILTTGFVDDIEAANHLIIVP